MVPHENDCVVEGVYKLYTPPDEKSPDIIFIHGIGGDAYKSWRNKKAQEVPVIPQTEGSYLSAEIPKGLPSFLHSRFPDSRIFTIQHNSPVFADKLGMQHSVPIQDTARNLLKIFGESSLQFGKRPIVFISHSLGGIILKEMLLQDLRQNSSSLFANQQIGCIFIGTPHLGTRIGRGVLAPFWYFLPRSGILENLEADSPYLVGLHEQFTQLLLNHMDNLTVLNFCENQTVSGAMVVCRDSAAPSNSNLGERSFDWSQVTYLIDKDHRKMCKPVSMKELLVYSIFDFVKKFSCQQPVSAVQEDSSSSVVSELVEIPVDCPAYIPASSVPLRPSSLSQLEQDQLMADFAKSYQQFRKNRNKLFLALSSQFGISKQEGQADSIFALEPGLAMFQYCRNLTQDNAQLYGLFDKTRSSGRSFLQSGLSDSLLNNCQKALHSHGYAELFNAFIICAPLDAANWKIRNIGSSSSSSTNHSIFYEPTDSWGRVLALNALADDMTVLKFLQEAQIVYSQLPKPTLEYDPFPSRDFCTIVSGAREYINGHQHHADGVDESVLGKLVEVLPDISL